MLSAEDEGDTMSVITWSGDGYRLIPSRFPPVSVYEGLVANDRLEALANVELLTNPRLRSEARLSQAAGGSQASPGRLQNWNLAPFAYGNPEGSTFFGEEHPCLELAVDRQTALAIAVARRERFLERTSEAAIGLDMRMLKTPVEGRFWDIRSMGTNLDRERRLELGAKLPDGADGILFHPPERPCATCVVVLNGDRLGRSLQTSHYRFVWDGKRISLLYAFDNAGREIEPQTLAGETDVLAA
jgi:hypothetical protein